MEQPLVSVIVPFYSRVDWLIEAINSVLKQTFKNVEILIINDGSHEDLTEVVKKYGTNISIINKENGGPASARNLGIKKSTGKYLAFLDSDDIWLPDKLNEQILMMEKAHYYWSHHSYEMFWEESNKTKKVNTSIYSGNIYRDCFISLKIQTSCVVVLRKILLENNFYFPEEKRFGQDLSFYKQIANSFPIGYVDGVYSRFRIRGSNAGFKAKIQIYDKASTWEEIKNDKELLKTFSKPILFAYILSSIFSKGIKKINDKITRNEEIIEIISKFMYSLPYVIFKFYSKKN